MANGADRLFCLAIDELITLWIWCLADYFDNSQCDAVGSVIDACTRYLEIKATQTRPL